MLLRILDLEGAFGLRTVSITASKGPEERAAAVAEFTSPRSACQVLVTTYNCGATGLNLRNSCYVAILMESAPNYNLEAQAIRRLHRIGQKRPQRAYRLFQDHTIARYLHNNNFKKMMPQIAVQCRDTFEAEVENENAARLSAERELAAFDAVQDYKRLSRTHSG